MSYRIGNKFGETHGLSNHPLYNILHSMKNRCYRLSNHNYNIYGGRGIYICDEWLNNPELFIYWALNNGWEPGLEVNRIDNNGPYSPENCNIVTKKENCRNRSTNRYATINGITATIADHADRLGVPTEILHSRIFRYNWPEERLGEPINQNRYLYDIGYIFPGTYLRVLDNLPVKKHKAYVRCECLYNNCGNIIDIRANDAKTGNTKTCGCWGGHGKLLYR